MGFDLDLEYIRQTAISDSTDAEVCRQVLISLWEDGEADGCELLRLLAAEKRCFDAINGVIAHLYSKRLQLDLFMSTREITTLAEFSVDMNAQAQVDQGQPYSDRR